MEIVDELNRAFLDQDPVPKTKGPSRFRDGPFCLWIESVTAMTAAGSIFRP